MSTQLNQATDTKWQTILASRLAQWIERLTIVREVEGSSPGRTNIQGLKITEENALPFYGIKKEKDILVFSDKDE